MRIYRLFILAGAAAAGIMVYKWERAFVVPQSGMSSAGNARSVLTGPGSLWQDMPHNDGQSGYNDRYSSSGGIGKVGNPYAPGKPQGGR